MHGQFSTSVGGQEAGVQQDVASSCNTLNLGI
jgi:hypothetical protein